MSFYTVGAKQYQNIPAGAPDWRLAPVPGWGMNPERAGAPIIATQGCGGGCSEGLGANDSEEQANQGLIAMGIAGGIILGWFFGWFYFTQTKKS